MTEKYKYRKSDAGRCMRTFHGYTSSNAVKIDAELFKTNKNLRKFRFVKRLISILNITITTIVITIVFLEVL